MRVGVVFGTVCWLILWIMKCCLQC